MAGGEHLEGPQAGLGDAVNVAQAGGDPLALLSRALDQTGALISRIRPDQATLPTPCPPWDVRALIEHVLQDVQRFTARASGGEWKEPDADVIGDGWTGAYRDAADSLLKAWGRDGALEATVKLPFGEFPASWFVGRQITDLVVHGWDIAKATGQSRDLDPELGRLALDWGKENLRPEFRGATSDPKSPCPSARLCTSARQDSSAPIHNGLQPAVTAEGRRPGQRFEQLVVRFLAEPGVSQGTGFGSTPGLRVGSKIFAMLGPGGELVVKLPKEWVTISARHGRVWARLAGEALRFVASAKPSRGP